MADKTMDSLEIILFDNWPGVAKLIGPDELPPGGFTGGLHHNVPAPYYMPGEKFCVWNPSTLGCEGMATMIYLQLGTQTATLCPKQPVTTQSATIVYNVTNDPDSLIGPKDGGALIAYALSAMTNAYYGWFWCGGVCPETLCPDLGGTYVTDSTVVAGLMALTDCLDTDQMGLALVAADTDAIVGMALAADDD
jgi:hypothetical protein